MCGCVGGQRGATARITGEGEKGKRMKKRKKELEEIFQILSYLLSPY